MISPVSWKAAPRLSAPSSATISSPTCKGSRSARLPDPTIVASNPFTALTFITAPGILTNAASVLAMSTSNRFLRATERLHVVSAELEKGVGDVERREILETRVARIELQAHHLLRALKCSYIALGAFAAASLVSLIGAALASYSVLHLLAQGSLLLALGSGIMAVIALVRGCVYLLRATNLSMQNVAEEAARVLSRAPKIPSSL